MARTRQWTLVFALLFGLAVGSAFFFGFRAGRTARRFHWQNEQIRPWMSVPFVAHSHHTRPELLFQAIHVSPDRRDRRSIREIAHDEKQPVAALIAELESAIAVAKQPESTAPNRKVP